MTRPLLTKAEVQAQAQQAKAAKVAQQRKRGVKKKNLSRGGKRFQGRAIPELREFVRSLDCLARRPTGVLWSGLPTCRGAVECAHVVSRGAGGEDFDNLVPLCTLHHQLSHQRGQRSFARDYGLNLKAAARKVTAQWLKERGQA